MHSSMSGEGIWKYSLKYSILGTTMTLNLTSNSYRCAFSLGGGCCPAFSAVNRFLQTVRGVSADPIHPGQPIRPIIGPIRCECPLPAIGRGLTTIRGWRSGHKPAVQTKACTTRLFSGGCSNWHPLPTTCQSIG